MSNYKFSKNMARYHLVSLTINIIVSSLMLAIIMNSDKFFHMPFIISLATLMIPPILFALHSYKCGTKENKTSNLTPKNKFEAIITPILFSITQAISTLYLFNFPHSYIYYSSSVSSTYLVFIFICNFFDTIAFSSTLSLIICSAVYLTFKLLLWRFIKNFELIKHISKKLLFTSALFVLTIILFGLSAEVSFSDPNSVKAALLFL